MVQTFRLGNQSARTRGDLGLHVLFQRGGLRHAPALRFLLLRLRGDLWIQLARLQASQRAARTWLAPGGMSLSAGTVRMTVDTPSTNCAGGGVSVAQGECLTGHAPWCGK